MNQKKKTITVFAVGCLIGGAVLFLMLLLIAFITVKTRTLYMPLIAPMAVIAGCTGAFMGGYMTARIKKSAGMLSGTICGGILVLAVAAVGLICGIIPTTLTLLRAAAMLLAGAAGGIAGVNKRKKKR